VTDVTLIFRLQMNITSLPDVGDEVYLDIDPDMVIPVAK
jgi:hypothetical protein